MREVNEIINRRQEEVDRIREVGNLMIRLFELYANQQPLTVEREGRRQHIPLVDAAGETVQRLIESYRNAQPLLNQRERETFEKVITQLTGTYILLSRAAEEYFRIRAEPDIQAANRYSRERSGIERNLERTIPRYTGISLW